MSGYKKSTSTDLFRCYTFSMSNKEFGERNIAMVILKQKLLSDFPTFFAGESSQSKRIKKQSNSTLPDLVTRASYEIFGEV